jgi:hypothetical protein
VNYLVLHVRPYSFTDDSNKLVEGATISYIDTSAPPRDDEKGFAPLQMSVGKQELPQFTEVPGFYEMSFTLRPGVKNRPQIAFQQARLTQGVEFTSPVVSN